MDREDVMSQAANSLSNRQLYYSNNCEIIIHEDQFKSIIYIHDRN